MRRIITPIHQIWIRGNPRSQQAKGPREKYIERIQSTAKEVIKEPYKTHRLGIEIWFQSDTGARSDVDNILKPILDALIGIAYIDDRQVRWVKAVAIPNDDHSRAAGPFHEDDFEMLEENFLINIFEGTIPGGTAGA